LYSRLQRQSRSTPDGFFVHTAAGSTNPSAAAPCSRTHRPKRCPDPSAFPGPKAGDLTSAQR
jgi:hypothetical protein